MEHITDLGTEVGLRDEGSRADTCFLFEGSIVAPLVNNLATGEGLIGENGNVSSIRESSEVSKAVVKEVDDRRESLKFIREPDVSSRLHEMRVKKLQWLMIKFNDELSVSIVMDQRLRLLHHCGLPKENVDFINSDGKTMNTLLLEAGSSRVAEKLAVVLKGRVKLEDAGFDWKILGPDVQEVDYIAWVCDQDAYACSGRKCSATSNMVMHENWASTSLISTMKSLAERRKLEDLTIGPVLAVTTEAMLDHMNNLLKIGGSK